MRAQMSESVSKNILRNVFSSSPLVKYPENVRVSPGENTAGKCPNNSQRGGC